jgi:hypothetical protein
MSRHGDATEVVDVLSDAQRCRDHISRAAAFIERVDARVNNTFRMSMARREIENFSILGIEGIATRAAKAATLDTPRFSEAYGRFFASIESLDRTVSRIEVLDEEGRLDEEAKADAAVDLITRSIGDLRMQTTAFDDILDSIHARDYIETVIPASRPAQQAIQEAAAVDTADIAQVAASQLTISNAYYENVLLQARRSFTSAIAAAVAGLTFFMVGVVIAVVYKVQAAAVVSTLSGAIVETIAGLNFWLYARTSQQLESFHRRLERMQRYLVANSVGEGLRGKARDAALSDLMKMIATGRDLDGLPVGQDAESTATIAGARSLGHH